MSCSARKLGWPSTGLVMLAVLGCDAGDEPPGAAAIAGFEPGAARDEVVAALPDGQLEGSERIGEEQLLHGYVLERYLIDGERVEVLWVHDPAVGAPESSEGFRELVNPLVFVGGEFDGAGWPHYESRMETWGLPEQWSVPDPVGDRGSGSDATPPDGGSIPNNPSNRV